MNSGRLLAIDHHLAMHPCCAFKLRRVAVRYNLGMADIPLYDESEEAPAPRPRAEVRFTGMTVTPYPDGRRMKLHFGLTPFEERPSVDVTVTNAAGHEAGSLHLIEAMDTAFDFTLHLRGPEPEGEHRLRLVLFYLASDEPDAGRQIVDEQTVTFDPTQAAARP